MFPVDKYDTLEYSLVKATVLSVRLRVFLCVKKIPTSFLASLLGNGSCVSLEPSSSVYSFTFYNHSCHMDSSPIIQLSALKGELLEPPPSMHPILTDGNERHPTFIAMVREQSFSGIEDKNPYTHLHEFEQLCSCLTIAGMTQETIKWKLFPFSLLDRVK